jgi:hypothetical protein
MNIEANNSWSHPISASRNVRFAPAIPDILGERAVRLYGAGGDDVTLAQFGATILLRIDWPSYLIGALLW